MNIQLYFIINMNVSNESELEIIVNLYLWS